MKKIHVIGGGTFSHVRSHLALAAPAFGTTARELQRLFAGAAANLEPVLHLTKMADHRSSLVTNDDVAALIDSLVADPQTRVVVLNAALCDFDGVVSSRRAADQLAGIHPPSGPHETRLKTSDGEHKMFLLPADKLIGRIRKTRKDIYVVGFKTTTDSTSDEQYVAALHLLKQNSLNLVLANDTVTRNNIIVAPEETRYGETTDRAQALRRLCEITLARASNTFTRSTVEPGQPVSWTSPNLPNNLREVVEHCIAAGAYKPFRGATVGHFAARWSEGVIITSRRKHDFNNLAQDGMVEVHYEGDDRVIAFGAKPSVGGQSQKIIFDNHPDVDCIVHFHCPIKPGMEHDMATTPQWPNECGSHECGRNTSLNLSSYGPRYGNLQAVMLEGHGPNICFSRSAPAEKIIEFIDSHFDLSQKTGGLLVG